VYQRMIQCKGVPVFRVDMKTKSRRGNGSRGKCVECHWATNIFCIICKKWLCDPQLAANRTDDDHPASDDPKYITITFDDDNMTGKINTICAIYLCWQRSHQASLEPDGALA
jgi:hypothetical protein